MSAPGSSLEAFYRRRLPDGSGASGPARLLQDALAESVDRPMPPTAWRFRRPSLCHDGTPVVYSIKLRPGAPAAGYRVLVEPGDPRTGVAEQIDLTLALTGRLLAELGWVAARPGVDALVRAALPTHRDDRDRLWGGLWLGAAVGERADRPELRLYVNLRHGEPVARWQRVADILAPHADPRLERPVSAWITRSAPAAVPVGLALAVREGSLAALRVYLGHHRPTLDSLAAVALVPRRSPALNRWLRGFEERFGALPPQAATSGHDFVFRDGRLQELGRAKIDLCCQLLGAAERPRLDRWLRGLPSALLGSGDALLGRFREDLREVFGGSTTEFLSAGFSGGALDHLTVYERPVWPPLD